MPLIPMVVERTARGERSSTSTRACSTSGHLPRQAGRPRSRTWWSRSSSTSRADDPDKDISIYINSPGGSIYPGLAIYDTMRFVKPDIATMCVGVAMSMGSLLLAAGTKGKRAGAAELAGS